MTTNTKILKESVLMFSRLTPQQKEEVMNTLLTKTNLTDALKSSLKKYKKKDLHLHELIFKAVAEDSVPESNAIKVYPVAHEVLLTMGVQPQQSDRYPSTSLPVVREYQELLSGVESNIQSSNARRIQARMVEIVPSIVSAMRASGLKPVAVGRNAGLTTNTNTLQTNTELVAGEEYNNNFKQAIGAAGEFEENASGKVARGKQGGKHRRTRKRKIRKSKTKKQ